MLQAMTMLSALHCGACTPLQVGPLPIGPDSTYVQQYPDGHIAWVKRPGDDLGDTGAMVCTPCDDLTLHAA